MSGWLGWLSPAWTAAEIAFTPTELNVGEDKALAYDQGYQKGYTAAEQYDHHHHDTTHHGTGHDAGSGHGDSSF